MKLAINRGWTTSLAIATTLSLSGAAGASDGVIEINQVCATSTGCSSGDGAGFPVDLGGFGTARSYILTSDLVPTNSGSAVFINGDDVSLNMNGFTIQCSPSSTFGIRVGSSRKNLHVWNGTIVGCQSRGIGGGGDGAHIDRITVDSSPGGGITVGDNSIVENSTVTDSGTDFQGFDDEGIGLGSNCIARNNIVSGAKFGIFSGTACLLEGNVVRDCGVGFRGQEGSTFKNNTVTNSNNSGIDAFGGGGSHVIGNTLRDNGNGLQLSADATYRGNAITGSTGSAIVGGTGQNRGGNTCISGAALIECP